MASFIEMSIYMAVFDLLGSEFFFFFFLQNIMSQIEDRAKFNEELVVVVFLLRIDTYIRLCLVPMKEV